MEALQDLKISPKKARELYPTSSTEWKEVLETSFGKEFFSLKPTDRIKTVADACEVLDIDPEDLWDESEDADVLAYKKLKVVVRALNFLANGNNDWIPNYNNASQRKWYPYFWSNDPGFRLYVCDCVRTASTVGARLVFLSEELARYAGTQFLGLYSNLYEI